MPWQRHVMDVALELDNDGLPAYHTVILVVMRQNGKTELLLPLMTHRATGWGPNQRILYTTQTASKAREKWQDIHVQRLQESPLAPMFTTRLRLNQEAMMWKNGSMWSPGAATAKTGGTGDTLNLGVIDEAWSRPDNRTEVGMRPAMLTQQNRQLWVCSMVPGASRASGQDSMYLRQKMRAGRKLVEQGFTSGIAYFEWSAEAGMDPADPATWWSCMPALGTPEQVSRKERTITEKTIRDDFESMELVDFCAEYLGWWPQENKPMWQFIKETTWVGLKDEQSQIAGRVAFGVDIDPARRHASIGVAGIRSDDDWHVEVIEPGGQVPADVGDIDWLYPRLRELVEMHDPLAIVIDGKSPARSMLTPLAAAGFTVDTPNGLEVAGACSRFFDATGQIGGPSDADDDSPAPVRVRHINQRSLNAAIAVASKLTSPTNGTFVYARTGGAGNLTPLYAVTLAMHGYEMNAANDYDILASVF
jgi:phage terminase large subunit-like protein